MLLSERLNVWKTAYNTANLPVGIVTKLDLLEYLTHNPRPG